LTLDRNDALNSAVANERDLGAFFYWAPSKIRERFAMLVKDGYKGSVIMVYLHLECTMVKPPIGQKEIETETRVLPVCYSSQIIEPGFKHIQVNGL
jgi:hypothetical protein